MRYDSMINATGSSRPYLSFQQQFSNTRRKYTYLTICRIRNYIKKKIIVHICILYPFTSCHWISLLVFVAFVFNLNFGFSHLFAMTYIYISPKTFHSTDSSFLYKFWIMKKICNNEKTMEKTIYHCYFTTRLNQQQIAHNFDHWFERNSFLISFQIISKLHTVHYRQFNIPSFIHIYRFVDSRFSMENWFEWWR